MGGLKHCILSGLVTAVAFELSSSFTAPLSTGKTSFIIDKATQRSTKLYEVITGTKDEELIDEGRGGVRLANENAIKLFGSNSKKNKSKGFPEVTGLNLYSKMTSFDFEKDENVQKIVSSCGISLIGCGVGNELYQDPGSTSEKNIVYAPSAAVKDVLSSISKDSMSSISKAKKLVLNFLGGDDLKTMEVLVGMSSLLDELEVDTSKMGIEFNSLSFNTFPEEVCTVTVVAVGNDSDEGSSDRSELEKCIANGEMYFHSGNWWAVQESDLASE